VTTHVSSARFGNDLRALDPGLHLVEGIEVVVAAAGLLVFREPVLVVAAVKPDVPCRGGYLGAGRNGLRKQRLCRCCRARSQLSEHVEDGLVPACMPHLQDQGKVTEPAKQVKEIRAVALNCRSSAPRRPSSPKGAIPSLNCRSSSAVAFRSCVKARKSFAVDRKRGFAPTRRAQLFAIHGFGGR